MLANDRLPFFPTFVFMRFLAAAFIFCGVASYGQSPQVPHKMRFAGMTLNIHADARQEIQKDVDALTSSPRYFNIKVQRAKTYFPIIEKIFREEQVPDELKYLVIQESALISDAVSTSNAVGYWQFKAETAKEMGLRVNNRVDERMNIVAASRGAARYFKQSNNYFNNWLLVVQSYQMGIGGTMREVGEEHFGSRHMDVTSDTYWYVRKYLAHKVAFEHALGEGKGEVEVTPVQASGVSLDEIAKESGVEMNQLRDYNKWIKNDEVPDDKEYTVVIPRGDMKDFNTLWLASNKKTSTSAPTTSIGFKETEVNGLRAVVAQSGETITTLSRRANVDLSDFIRWNDVSVDWKVSSGQIYYLQKKIKNPAQPTHLAKSGESLWSVSQQYGMRLKTLKRLNDKLTSDQLKQGTIVYLDNAPDKVNAVAEAMIELDHKSPFEWGISGKSEKDYVIKMSESTPAPSKTETAAIVVGQESTPPLTTNTEHTVVGGDTWFSIARQHNMKVSDLQRINGAVNSETLKQGQIIKLTDNEVVEARVATHEVQPTDTIYSIARQYGLSVKELMDLNNKKDFDIKPGQKLIIK
jgi:membrane-bound lytic murein transglycosylase D